MSFNALFEKNKSDENPEGIQKVKKVVRKKTIKLMASAVLITIIIFLLYSLLLQPVINDARNKAYYNPNQFTYSNSTNDLGITLATYTQLHIPSVVVANFTAVNTGIGEYDFDLQYWDSFERGDHKNIYGHIKKGKLTTQTNFFSNTVPLGMFSYDDGHVKSISVDDDGTEHEIITTKEDMQENKRDTLSKLKKLPDSAYVKAYISFDKDLSMSELLTILKKYKGDCTWIVVRNESQEKELQNWPLIGFKPNGNSIWWGGDIKKYYPDYEAASEVEYGDKGAAAAYEKSFRSLLQFQLDHLEDLKVFDVDRYVMQENNYGKYYKAVLDFVEKNGVKTYGIVLQTSPQELQRICGEDVVCEINAVDVRLSLDNLR